MKNSSDGNRVRSQRFRKNNPGYYKEYMREYHQRHKEKKKAAKKRRRAKLRGVESTLTIFQWEKTLEVFGGLCAYCESSGPITQDHVKPLADGGTHTLGNVVPCCRPCNLSKHVKNLQEWLDDDIKYEALVIVLGDM